MHVEKVLNEWLRPIDFLLNRMDPSAKSKLHLNESRVNSYM